MEESNSDEAAGSELTADDAFPVLGNDLFLEVMAQMDRHGLAIALGVCKAWQTLLDATAQLWRAHCNREWDALVYVPASLQIMAQADAGAEASSGEQEERRELMGLKTRELRQMMGSLRIQIGVGNLIEKGDFADAILGAQRLALAMATDTEKMLKRPSMLVRREQGESLPKAALRLSLADASRTFLTAEELVTLTFNVRVRHDGPLAPAMRFDPWWLGKGRGQAKFEKDGRLSFSWPPDPESGEPMDPFAALGMRGAVLSWELAMGGRIIQLLFNGQIGPQEVVCRHPINLGWVLYSQGTCWTSWEMPEVKDGECADPLLREENLHRLPGIEREI